MYNRKNIEVFYHSCTYLTKTKYIPTYLLKLNIMHPLRFISSTLVPVPNL